jgi:two-component system, NarL family, nitrate/nitrite response regulator NarL
MASDHKVRVLIADSSPLHSQLLAEAVGRDRHIKVVGTTVDAASVVSTALECRPDVLLISATLDAQPNRGLGILQELQAERSNLKAVVLLDSSTPNTIVQAFLFGARGVFYRNASLTALCKCIRVVHEGQIWANSEEVGFLLAALAAAGPSMRAFQENSLKLLSKRERDVVRCLAGAGLSNREISQHLGISDHTVKNYMLRIFDKLGVSSRVELMFYVLGTGGTDAICNTQETMSTVKVGSSSGSEPARKEQASKALPKADAAPKDVWKRSPRPDGSADKDQPTIATRLGSA